MESEINIYKSLILVDLMLLQILLQEIWIYNHYLLRIRKIILFKKIKRIIKRI